MSKSFLYRLFGIGKIPEHALQQIRKEGVVLQDEGIGGSVTLRKFRAPGKRFSWRRNWFSGSVVLTREHFLAFKFSQPVVGVAWHDHKLKALNCFLVNENTLCVAFDASTFRDDWSGDIELRFTTPLAQSFLQKIKQYGA
ncbi:MAG: hypothetical protein OET44_08495 [Gammaproteobacteria bacterium]|nr:hypothetical protein [Gammaproteobacteria bacterium]